MLLYSYIPSCLGTCSLFWQMRAFEGNPPNSIEPRTTHSTIYSLCLEYWGQLNAHLLVKQTHFLGKWNTVDVGKCQARIWCWSNCKPSCRCVCSIVMLWRLELLLAYGSNSQGVSDAGIRQTGVLIMGELLLIIDAHYNQRLCCSHYSYCWVKCIYTRRVESSTGTNIQACGVPNNAEETHSYSCCWCH